MDSFIVTLHVMSDRYITKCFHVNAVRDKQVLWVFWLDREGRPDVALFQSDRKFRQTVFLLMCVFGGLNLATFWG